jgi:glyoxylate reductase
MTPDASTARHHGESGGEYRCIVTRSIPAAGLELIREAGIEPLIVQPDPETPVDRARLLAAAAQADVLLALLTERIDEELLQRSPRLRGVANMAVGYNNIDVAAATRFGVPVSNTPGVLTEATADLTWALLLAVARHIPQAHAYMTAGRFRIWGPELFLGSDVGPGVDGTRRTLGIIGFGRIGQAVARRARGFDMRVLAFSPRSRAVIEAYDGVTYASADTILAESDFVTLHAAYSEATRHLIDERALRRMKPAAYLINAARGELVDEQALVRALNEGWIAGAALDVFEREPTMAEGLAACRNAVLVPHIGSATSATRDRMATTAARNTLAHLRFQRAPDVVNPEVYETAAYLHRRSGR